MRLTADVSPREISTVQRSPYLPPLPPTRWGGERRGAGRKPGPNPKDWHVARPPIDPRQPAYLILRMATQGITLRTEAVRDAVVRVLRELHSSRQGFRVIAFGIRADGLHLIVEADTAAKFSSGVRALCIRFGRRLNQVLGRKGRLFYDRYHRQMLATPTEVRQAFTEVLLGGRTSPGLDPYSSAAYFDGWDGPLDGDSPSDPAPVRPPRTWLARTGWRQEGLLTLG